MVKQDIVNWQKALIDSSSDNEIFKYLYLINFATLENSINETRRQIKWLLNLSLSLFILGFFILAFVLYQPRSDKIINDNHIISRFGNQLHYKQVSEPPPIQDYLHENYVNKLTHYYILVAIITEFFAFFILLAYKGTIQKMRYVTDNLIEMQGLATSLLTASTIKMDEIKDEAKADIIRAMYSFAQRKARKR